MAMKMVSIITLIILLIMFITSCALAPHFEYSDIYHINFNFRYSDGSTQHRHEFTIVWYDETSGRPAQYSFSGFYSTNPIITSLFRHEFDERRDRYIEHFDSDNRKIVYVDTIWEISPIYMEELKQILESHNISEWNGFRVSANRDIHDSFFWLRAITRSGREVSASAFVETPEGFDEAFPVLVSFFNDMVQRYILQPIVEYTETINISDYQKSESATVTKIEWKVIFYEDDDYNEPYFRLYLVINGEMEYYAGSGFAPRSQLTINDTLLRLDAPTYALSTLSSLWTGLSQQFYVYRKSDTELAVMSRFVDFMSEDRQEYKKTLIIPIENGTQIRVGESLIVKEPVREPIDYK